jgi:hypothetical protein
MTVRAKTLVKDKFWIVEQNGQKLGTLQKQDDNGWIFLSKKDSREVFHTQESLFTKFGFGMFDEANVKNPKRKYRQTTLMCMVSHVANILTIPCLTCRSNCRCTPRHPRARASSVRVTT